MQADVAGRGCYAILLCAMLNCIIECLFPFIVQVEAVMEPGEAMLVLPIAVCLLHCPLHRQRLQLASWCLCLGDSDGQAESKALLVAEHSFVVLMDWCASDRAGVKRIRQDDAGRLQ